MKKSILIIILTSLLFSICFSYRVADKNSSLAEGKKYKIQLSKHYEKVKLLSSTDSTITVINTNSLEKTMAKTDILKIRKRHFSIIKTALLPIGIVVVAVGIIFASYKPQFGKTN